MCTTATPSEVDEFASELLSHYTSGILSLMIDLGHRTGLFDVVAQSPQTSDDLASRSGLHERYIREWLASLVTGGIVDYDPLSATYELPAERAAVLTGTGSSNLAALAQLNTHLGKHLHQVAESFRSGGGVPYSEFRPEFTDVMDALSRSNFDELLVDHWLPLDPELCDRLRDGARVADVGCGTGHSTVVLATAFPASTFVGIDIATDAIERARTEADEYGLTNVRFEATDATSFTTPEPLDVVFTFDAIHDQVDPRAAVEQIYGALASGGVYVMVEPAGSSRLEDNIANPIAPWLYGVSTLHCMTVSLAHGGAGLGTVWGHQQACEMLTDVGFVDVAVHDAPENPFDTIFIARKP